MTNIVMISTAEASKAVRRRDQWIADMRQANLRAAVERAEHHIIPRREIAEGYAVGVLIGIATGVCWGMAIALRGWVG